MNHMVTMYKNFVVVFFSSSVLLAGCATPASYTKPITKFQEASTAVIEDARAEYITSNQRELEAFIDKNYFNRQPITLKDLNSSSVYLLNNDDLVARLQALDVLTKHASLLLALSSSNAPEKAKTAATELDESVISLKQSLGGNVSDNFKTGATLLTDGIGELTLLITENKINKALDRSIILSENEVQNIIKLLKKDMDIIYQRKKTIVSNYRVNSVRDYNNQLVSGKNDADKLNELANNIKKSESEWNKLSLSLSIQSNFETMSQAYKELVDYAKSSKTPQDISDLNDAIDVYVARAKLIKDNLNYLKNNIGE